MTDRKTTKVIRYDGRDCVDRIDACAALNVHRGTLRQMVAEGKIRAYRLGTASTAKLLFDLDDIVVVLNAQAVERKIAKNRARRIKDLRRRGLA